MAQTVIRLVFQFTVHDLDNARMEILRHLSTTVRGTGPFSMQDSVLETLLLTYNKAALESMTEFPTPPSHDDSGTGVQYNIQLL